MGVRMRNSSIVVSWYSRIPESKLARCGALIALQIAVALGVMTSLNPGLVVAEVVKPLAFTIKSLDGNAKAPHFLLENTTIPAKAAINTIVVPAPGTVLEEWVVVESVVGTITDASGKNPTPQALSTKREGITLPKLFPGEYLISAKVTLSDGREGEISKLRFKAARSKTKRVKGKGGQPKISLVDGKSSVITPDIRKSSFATEITREAQAPLRLEMRNVSTKKKGKSVYKATMISPSGQVARKSLVATGSTLNLNIGSLTPGSSYLIRITATGANSELMEFAILIYIPKLTLVPSVTPSPRGTTTTAPPPQLTPTPRNTPVPPTQTPAPTPTQVPPTPTATRVPPTATPLPTATVVVVPPTNTPPPPPSSTSFYRAFNFGGPALTIDGQQWEAGTAAGVSTNGWVLIRNDVNLLPATDSARTSMIRSFVYNGSGTSVAISSVPVGTYDVSLFVWEDNFSEAFNVAIEGVVRAPGVVSGPAGTWKEVGPYRVTVNDGALNVVASGGTANFSGLRILRVAGGTAPTPTSTPVPSLPTITPTNRPVVPTNTPVPAATATPIADIPPQFAATFESSIKGIIDSQCMLCHSGVQGKEPAWQNNLQWLVASGYVKPGFPTQSRLYASLRGNTDNLLPASMPKVIPALSATQIQQIRSWISSGNPAAPTPTSTPTPQPGMTPTTPPPPAPFQFTCNESQLPTVSPLKRLTKQQMVNSVFELLQPLASGNRIAVTSVLSSIIQRYPEDIRQNGLLEPAVFPSTDLRISGSRVRGFYDIALKFAAEVSSDDTRVREFSHFNCTIGRSGADLTCLRNFIDRFGLRVFRRPLTAAEKTRFEQIYMSQPAGRDSFRTLVGTMLMSPEFFYLTEVGGSGVSGQASMLTLNDYEIASRLSYLYWQSMPDDALFQAAANGQLRTEVGRKAQIDRMFTDARVKVMVEQFFEDHLTLDKLPAINARNTTDFAGFANGFQVSVADEALSEEMRQEVRDMVNYYVWQKNSSFGDMFTSQFSFAKGPRLAQLYGVPQWSGSPTQLISFPAPAQARGLLGRAAVQATGNTIKNIAHLGSKVVREWMCQDIPPPPAEAQDAIQPPATTTQTSRQGFEQLTSPASCNGCHKSINPPGFVMERFDALGRYREAERVLSGQGALLASLPINSSAEVEFIPGVKKTVSQPIDIFHEMVASGRVNACLAQQFFRFGHRVRESVTNDGCVLKSMTDAHTSTGRMQDMFKAIGTHPHFVQRRIQ